MRSCELSFCETLKISSISFFVVVLHTIAKLSLTARKQKASPLSYFSGYLSCCSPPPPSKFALHSIVLSLLMNFKWPPPLAILLTIIRSGEPNSARGGDIPPPRLHTASMITGVVLYCWERTFKSYGNTPSAQSSVLSHVVDDRSIPFAYR